LKNFGPPISSMTARLPSIVSGTLLKKRHSLMDPCGPPSALEPLSEISMISVLSYSPIFFRNATSSPM